MGFKVYRGTSLTRNSPTPKHHHRALLQGSRGRERFLGARCPCRGSTQNTPGDQNTSLASAAEGRQSGIPLQGLLEIKDTHRS